RYNLPHPQAIFDINYFRRNPQPFYTLASEIYPGNFSPTTCHYFVRLLSEKGILLRQYTQNIDTLERLAGIDPDLIVEAHGSFATAQCVGPEETDSSESDSDSDDAAATTRQTTLPHAATVPRCESCSGLVKPDIVFFGEKLPPRFSQLSRDDLGKCDLLIVIGTSLAVYPFASLINYPAEDVPRLLINREVVGVHARGFDFVGDVQRLRRDALFEGGCDEGVIKLAELLGWGEEL
ncbi:DHS-like NAD/FAD-binding domain-containing protein, partial [Blyttiomyces helicus]